MSGINHAKHAAGADDLGYEILLSDWNTDHTITDGSIAQAKIASLVDALAGMPTLPIAQSDVSGLPSDLAAKLTASQGVAVPLIADPGAATAADVANKINALLTSLVVGQVVANAGTPVTAPITPGHYTAANNANPLTAASPGTRTGDLAIHAVVTGFVQGACIKVNVNGGLWTGRNDGGIPGCHIVGANGTFDWNDVGVPMGPTFLYYDNGGDITLDPASDWSYQD